ncbi:hypothetical protein AVEN_126941-1 [Araneus ventricosus]|uniref:Uncharacterized protein n=1 Tax=Araneus ventricosus TaxID=182803 RepID=A0A4Y2FFB2_ARAVE|nr:hypothetical protein AVEN_102040-1 [Araneus ventricosus]GBM39869.1 hypothetical protein AVEN_190303-1 [Araneus ventricosus]GBM39905.1 hypothetical protein AVEN_113791-1 [Araneus ventricosus]GBM39911.1 hypothetical protein AVEN_126941-1 [Araneus ventricosus]
MYKERLTDLETLFLDSICLEGWARGEIPANWLINSGCIGTFSSCGALYTPAVPLRVKGQRFLSSEEVQPATTTALGLAIRTNIFAGTMVRMHSCTGYLSKETSNKQVQSVLFIPY